MYRYRPSVQNALLFQVDLLQEVEHAAGVGGDSVVGPGLEVVLPNCAFSVALGGYSTIKFKKQFILLFFQSNMML